MSAKAEKFPSYPNSRYSSDIPEPEKFIGYSVGERFTHYSDIMAYYDKLATVSNRIKIIEYGQTNERRKLRLLLISSPENLANSAQIRQENIRLGDPRTLSTKDLDRITMSLPSTVWLSYGVHGDESSSCEAAMQVVYHLLADQSEETAKILKGTFIIIDPLVNPDGRERYVSFYEQSMGKHPRSDVNAYEHAQSWPGGRFNHYLFDLNRDWAWMTQVESYARVQVFRQWQPQTHVDYHEMSPDSTYFFPPAAKPINQNLPPIINEWLDIFGKGNAAMLDRFGVSFYTREDYDLQYPSYGDSWPSLNGAIGMTYEQGGGGRAGLSYKPADKLTTLTLRDRTWHHFLTSVATLKTAVDNREKRLRDYYKFRQQAIENGKTETMKSFVLLNGEDPARTAKLVNLLMAQGIEVHKLKSSFKTKNAHSYFSLLPQLTEEKEFPVGSYIVNLAQPTGILAKALLEPEAVLKDLYFYDVTGWSLPLAYGVESYWLEELIENPAEKLTEKVSIKGEVIGEKAQFAYLFGYESNAAAKTLIQLLNENYEAFVALKPVKVLGRQFNYGAIVVPVEKNPPQIHQRIAELARENGHTVIAAPSARTEDGIDLGSTRVRFIRKPKVLVVTGPGINVTDYGSIWFQFDEVYGVDFIPVAAQQLGGVDLRNYNTIILPDDQNGAYERLFGKGTIEKLSRWIREGGTLIAVKGGAVFATAKQSGLTSVTYKLLDKREEEDRIDREKEKAKDAKEQQPSSQEQTPARKPEELLAEKLVSYADKEQKRMAESIPGTLMKIKLDNTHPLGLGYKDELVILNVSSPILSLTSKGDNVAYYPKENFKISGFLTIDNEKKLSHSGFLIKERLDKGSVILYADDPNFRSFWEGTTRLFLNGILFGNIIDPNIE